MLAFNDRYGVLLISVPKVPHAGGSIPWGAMAAPLHAPLRAAALSVRNGPFLEVTPSCQIDS